MIAQGESSIILHQVMLMVAYHPPSSLSRIRLRRRLGRQLHSFRRICLGHV